MESEIVLMYERSIDTLHPHYNRFIGDGVSIAYANARGSLLEVFCKTGVTRFFYKQLHFWG